MRPRAFVAACLLGLAPALPASAALITYDASLTGAAEAPANASPGIGATLVTYDDVAHTLRVQVVFSGLFGTTTASHIHCCTTNGNDVTLTAGVATQVPTFAGFPLGVTAGSYDRTFDLTLASSWNPNYITNNGGTAATAEAVFVAGLDAEKAYLNIHTSYRTGGEIRGFLQRCGASTAADNPCETASAPEPGTLALLGLGLAGLAATRRRKR